MSLLVGCLIARRSIASVSEYVIGNTVAELFVLVIVAPTFLKGNSAVFQRFPKR
jgi:hypothetical protein